MATVEEVIVTGRKYRIFDAVNEVWKRVSYWTKAVDVEFNDGLNLEEKITAVVNNTNTAITNTTTTLTTNINNVNTTLTNKINALDVSDPSANGTTITAIDTIKQTDGKIAATKKTIRSATAAQTGVVKLSDKYTSSDGAAANSIGASNKAVYDCYTTLNNGKINKSNLVFTLSGSDLYITKTY